MCFVFVVFVVFALVARALFRLVFVKSTTRETFLVGASDKVTGKPQQEGATL